MSLSFNKAIVIGGGIAGLLCARVLSDASQEVVIFEKEQLPENLDSRQGIPQGFHNHTLLESGRRILDEYFPGFSEELVKLGNKKVNQTAGLKWFHHGVWKYRKPIELTMNIQSRWHLEGLVRKYIKNISNIEIQCSKVDDVIVNGENISGIILDGKEIQADIVIDCSGPASQLKKWLPRHGFICPPELRVKIDLKYSSYLYKRDVQEKYDWDLLAIYPEAPNGHKSGVVFPIIDEKHGPCWLVTAVGRNGEFAGKNHADFLEFMKNLDQPDIYECISNWQLIEEKGHHISFHENIRTYYDHLLRYPAGLLPCGDSFGRINPIFGQGMSIAAIESEILKKTLSEVNDLKTLTSLYLKRIGCFFDIPWFLVNCEDWRYPHIPGRRRAVKLINCNMIKNIASRDFNGKYLVINAMSRNSSLFSGNIELEK